MKTEAYKLYSRVLFLPYVIKIDLYNLELYRFKIGAFFRHSVATVTNALESPIIIFLDEIALAAQTIPPIPTHLSVAWSLSLSVCLSHSYALLKPFDGFRCHLAGTLVGSSDTLC